ncbi:MAG: histidine kinase [Bacteroidia bacterium]|nr:histidine kinase [Bacteroidia bacterium]
MKQLAIYTIAFCTIFSACLPENQQEKKAGITGVDVQDSLSHYSSADSLAVIEKCRKLLAMADEYSLQGKASQAITADSQALVIAENAGMKKEMLKVLKRLERKYAIQLKRTQSLQLIYKGLKIAEELKDKREIIDFYSANAMWYFYGGEYDKALEIEEKCLKMSRDIHYSFGISSALIDIGSIYMNKGEKAEGAKYFFANRIYADSLKGSVYQAQIYQSIGSAFEVSGLYDSAIYFAKKACHTADSLRDKKTYSGCLSSLAEVLNKQGRLDEAEEMAVKSLEISREINFKAQMPGTLDILKHIAIKQNDYKHALTYYQEYVAIQNSLKDDKTMLEAQEKEYAFNLEKKESENLLLTQKNEIQQLQIRKTRYVMVAFIFLAAALLIIGYLLYHQSRIKAVNWKMTAEQKLLRAQMNPHFIFNSLNSIRYFILSNQNTLAEKYLSTFSKLIRNTLEASIDDTVSVDQEAQMLRGYLEIESLRFNGKFEYEIIVDEKLKGDTVRIPQLMIQPFVENAIWHGLLPKTADRKLTIHFSAIAPDKVNCSIEDNGIGRAAAAAQESKSGQKHLALDFARQRLQLLAKTVKSRFDMVLTDKYDEFGNATGLRVSIELPNLYQYKPPVRNEV